MMTPMENFIEDMMDDSMQSYANSEEYLVAKNAIDAKIRDFESRLNQEQVMQLNQLIELIDNGHAMFVVEAYKAGVKDSPKLRADVSELFGVTLD